jgi:hypothetical protein
MEFGRDERDPNGASDMENPQVPRKNKRIDITPCRGGLQPAQPPIEARISRFLKRPEKKMKPNFHQYIHPKRKETDS